MSFSQNVDILLTTLGASNTDIARCAGCTPSNISRLRSGSRTPKPASPTVRRLVDGAYIYAEKNNLFSILYESTGIITSGSADNIKESISIWLFGESTAMQMPLGSPMLRRTPFRFFGDKLGAVMTLLELSNVRLGKALSLDPSYISRFRNGVRTPKSNTNMIDSMCGYLFERAKEQGKVSELLRLMGVPQQLTEDEDYCVTALCVWLCDTPETGTDTAVEKLLESIDCFSPSVKIPLPDFASAVSGDILNSQDTLYIGNDGLQSAVLRFLGNAALESASELLLYSDRSISWLTDDKVFRAKWLTLMSSCVKSGTKIRIIHNIDRNISEMIAAIESWLPLYMSGQIEPYTCRRKADGRFAHTLFLRPASSCIEACHVKGYEENGLYNYYTDVLRLEHFREEFAGLLESSEPLVKIYTQSDGESYLSGIRGDGMTTLLPSLSSGTMPRELLMKILERAEINDGEKEKLLTAWETQSKLFMKSLETGYVYELTALPSDEELYSGGVLLGTGLSCGLRISYTAAEYAEHITAIRTLLKTRPSYRFYPLSETPYTNMHLILGGDRVIIMNSASPRIAFVFTNPFLHGAFREYTHNLRDKCKCDRNEVIKTLMRFL